MASSYDLRLKEDPSEGAGGTTGATRRAMSESQQGIVMADLEDKGRDPTAIDLSYAAGGAMGGFTYRAS